ncbi:MAG: hypothetical protein KDD37_03390 [Bdellovibrionales bacterium]|nr:hypothetical protein [Bdellovibrionales bacterium]
MKKALFILLITFTGNVVVACSHVEKDTDEKRDVASEDANATWKAHQKYLDKLDKIR